MNELETVNEIINNAVRDSSYVTVVISCCVFIIYTLINKYLEYIKNKSKNKPLYEMAEAIKGVSTNVVMLNSVLDKLFKDVEKKELQKCRAVINVAFNSFYSKISHECDDMIINNHIETNKNLITENVTKIINSEYYKLYGILSNYEVNDCNVATKLEKEWITELINSVLSIMYNGQDAITRISQLNNRLNVDLNNYSTVVYNKVFSN